MESFLQLVPSLAMISYLLLNFKFKVKRDARAIESPHPVYGGRLRKGYDNIIHKYRGAWIQSGTIRDNILSGRPMVKTKYEEAIRACALDKDINSFDYGDLTEIGQRGLNMSGGQKQRIQLCRAVYSDADIYLLDDPFSAVDAHTTATLFNDCVMAALEKKTVILVTNQVEFLLVVDHILVMECGRITGECLKNYDLENVIVDPYFNRITSKMRTCGEDVTEIEVKPDGSWRVKPVTEQRCLGDLTHWHFPDGSLRMQTVKEAISKSEVNKVVKHECTSEGHTGLKLGIKKNINGICEVSKPGDSSVNR